MKPQMRTPHANPIGPLRKWLRMMEKKAPPNAPPVVMIAYTDVSNVRASSDDGCGIPWQSRVSS